MARKPPQSPRTVVTVETEYLPEAKSVWDVTLPTDAIEDELLAQKLILAYNNLAYDLVAAALAKLGVEYSKLLARIAEGDMEAFSKLDAEMSAALDSLKPGTVLGE